MIFNCDQQQLSVLVDASKTCNDNNQLTVCNETYHNTFTMNRLTKKWSTQL